MLTVWRCLHILIEDDGLQVYCDFVFWFTCVRSIHPTRLDDRSILPKSSSGWLRLGSAAHGVVISKHIEEAGIETKRLL